MAAKGKISKVSDLGIGVPIHLVSMRMKACQSSDREIIVDTSRGYKYEIFGG